MKKNRFAAFLCFLCMALLVACEKNNDDDTPTPPPAPEPPFIPEEFDTNSQEIDFDKNTTIQIHFNQENESVLITNPFENEGVDISVEKQHIVISSTMPEDAVSFLLTGNSLDGSVKIYSDFRFDLIFNGVSLLSQYGPAFNIQSGKRIRIRLVEHTNNRLADSGNYPPAGAEDMKAAFFSEGQLIFQDKGNLQVYGMDRHAICSDDYIRIEDGNIDIPFCMRDAIHVNDYFEMRGGKLTVKNTVSNGIECEKGYIEIYGGDIDIESMNDGIIASYREEDLPRYIEIAGGNIKIKTTDEDSNGLEGREHIYINGGTLEIDVLDDGIKAAGNISITGGNIYTFSSGNDGMDAKGNIRISGGTVIACGSPENESGIDRDGELIISGGTVIASGGAKSTPDQVSNGYSIVYNGSVNKNEYINIRSEGGEEILNYQFPENYPSLKLMIYSGNILSGTSYRINQGGSVSGGENFNGYITGGSYTGGSTVAGFTASSDRIITVPEE